MVGGYDDASASLTLCVGPDPAVAAAAAAAVAAVALKEAEEKGEVEVEAHAFAAEPEEQLETDALALGHLKPWLVQAARNLGKEPSTLVIYDPYFCSGALKRHLAARLHMDLCY